MSIAQIQYRYARSLFEYAKETGETESIFKDITYIRHITTESRELYRMFFSPVVKPDKKIAVLQKIFGDTISKATHKFFELIINKGREANIREIADTYIRIYNESKNIVEAKITTAVDLDDKLRDEIKAKLKAKLNKEINLKEKVDPKILGGYILSVKDKQEDKSLKTKLNRLKRDFESNRVTA
ncbi:MAG: ATP synthase F1 subunit delta [Bacteroidia bacterium]